MKEHIYKKTVSKNLASVIGILTLLFWMVSCSSDDDAAGGPIAVNTVYLQDVDSDVPDREVTFVRIGQLIRLEGSGFTDLKRVFVNGFETSFNPVYVSDNSFLLRVSGDTPVLDAEEGVRNTIRLVNDSFETTFDFEIRDAAPSITRMSHTLPNPGEVITVFGTGLTEVNKVIFPGDIEVTDNITFDEDDGEFFTVIMPEGVSEAGGSIRIESANGAAASPAYFNFREGVILDFDGMGSIGEFGNTIRQEDLESAQIGEGHVSQGTYVPHRPAGVGEFGAGSNRITEVFTDGSENWRAQLTPFIPADTPLEEVAFQFDVYVPGEWEGSGFLQILLINNFNGGEWTGGTYGYVPWIVDGEIEAYETEGWTTVTIPLSDFYLFEEEEDATFEDVLTLRETANFKNFGMFFNNTDINLGDVTRRNSDVEFPASDITVDVYSDNWRIVSLDVPTITDFPE